MSTELLKLEGIVKQFGGARALDGVTLSVRAGEVHGLLGQNGSGKSTLIKVLAGYHAPDAGTLTFRGKDVALPLAPGVFSELGMGFVHQDLGLVGSLSVLENLRVEALVSPPSRLRIAWGAERAAARAVLGRYGLDYDVRARVDQLRPGERAQLALVRAVEGMRGAGEQHGGGLLVLDEITAFLTSAEIEELFALVRRITAEGASVLFVSHDLDEVFAITDRVTVLRDGRTAGERTTAEADETELVSLIVGRELKRDTTRPAAAAPDAGVALAVRELRQGGLRVSDLEVRRGEIVGATGLLGSGFDDFLYALFGASEQPVQGTIAVAGRELDLAHLSPPQAMAAGLALVPADRANAGSMPGLPVGENLTSLVLDRHAKAGFLSRSGLRRHADGVLDRFDVRPRDPTLLYGALSGGNQQKVLVAKWLEIAPDVLLVHEPTQGVDVGAREQIFGVLNEAAAGGAGLLCASADHEQLARICHRILIFSRGRVVVELSGDAVTAHAIGEASLFGGRAPHQTQAERERLL